jgi:O-antigen/teichoic acid export membrane protein
MKGKLLKDLSANTLQMIINQVCGLLIFYVLSVFFSKNDFGEINWSLAILLTAFSILSLGIDQLVVKKIAEGISPQKILSVYFLHVLLTGCFFYLSLLVLHFIFRGFHHQLLLFLGLGKLMIFFASPFKQLTNGLEKFKLLLYMSICSNIVRSFLLIVFAFWGSLSLSLVIIIFIIGDTAEFILSFVLNKTVLKIPLTATVSKTSYFNILKESLPQAGVVIFTSAIARFDWIFLGILASNIALAEYSFAFKVFEVASLPLLVIATILIPRFTRIFRFRTPPDIAAKQRVLAILFKFEMIISSLVALVLNILWVPVIDYITHNKYGAVNSYTIFILSACMPFVYANNFLWTLNFAKGKLKMIFFIFLSTFLVNVICDIILIPRFGGEGAAAGYFLAIAMQFFLFSIKTNIDSFNKKNYTILICPLIAFISGILSNYFIEETVAALFVSIILFFFLLIISRQIIPQDLLEIKHLGTF